MQGPGFAGAAAAAAAVVQEVSQRVRDIEAPDTDQSFVAMDESRRDLVDEEGLPLVYNKDAIQKYWEGQGGALQARWAEFLAVSVPFLTRVAALLVSGGSDALNANARELARDARQRIEKLGPTYVKMGQMMSVRPDVLPQAALDELVILQDGVQGFPSAIARQVVERELGAPIADIFSEFAEEPAAAASLAQVYRAVLRSTGEVVAVKVQRPGVQELVSKDLYVLRRAAEVYQGLVQRFAPQQRTNYVALLNEWAVGFYTELDFKNEAANMVRMAEVLEQAHITDVAVPRVKTELTTRRVLVSEWVDGVKLSDCDPQDVKELIAIGQECFLVQLLQAGFFHSDPHPGNLMRPHDQSRAKLVLIDFGLVAQIKREDQDLMVSSIIHLANKDYAALVDDFIGLQILPADCNRAKVIPLMDKALSPYVKGGGAKKYEAELKQMYGMDGSTESAIGGFQAMTNDMLTVLNDIPFSIPPYFALLARAVVTLEGLALSADPDYGLVLEAYPFVARKLLSSDRPELQQALQEVLYGGGDPSLKGVVTPTRLAALINSAAGIVARQQGAAFIDLDAVPEGALSPSAAARFLLSPGSASIRALLADEAFGAADLLLRQALRKAVPLIAAALPQPPRLPFLPPPPDVLDLPLPLPRLGGSAAAAGFPALPAVTSARQLLDALSPKLSRDEELYAISLVDLVKGSLGEETAALIAGDLSQDPLAAARAALPLVSAAVEAQGDAADSRVVQLAQASQRLLDTLPLGGGRRAAGANNSGSGHALRQLLSEIQLDERHVLQNEVQALTYRLRERLDSRLAAVVGRV
jgi:predicted unusual protein kinase regulating ubiquinone biosynthesis (AarF/ABC1/UbiB family)